MPFEKGPLPHPAGAPRQPAPHPQRHLSGRTRYAAPRRARSAATLYRGDLSAIRRGYGCLRPPRPQPAGTVDGTCPRHQPSTLHARLPGLGVPIVTPCGGRPPQRTHPSGLGRSPSGEGCRAGAPTRGPWPTHQSGLPPHVRGALRTPSGSGLRGGCPCTSSSTSRRCVGPATPKAPCPS